MLSLIKAIFFITPYLPLNNKHVRIKIKFALVCLIDDVGNSQSSTYNYIWLV